MAEANNRRVGSESSRENAATNLSLFPKDLLQRFTPLFAEDEDEDEDKAEIELNLGLSLGGRFGVDKGSSSGSKKLTRSSSIVGTMPIIREEKSAEAAAEIRASTAPPLRGLTRTTSLPTETEEEWRKRKEIQTLRRMEAKRRRSEKQRNINTKTEANNPEGSGLPARWSTAANKGGFLRKHSEISRQGSVESHGGDGGSSSELDFKPLQAGSSNQEQTSQETTPPPATKPPQNVLRRLSSVDMSLQVKKEKSEMPSVFTRGEGPNGKRVEGILYKYGKGEEVRIMCVCHGSFLSPAEFVKHAGGGDVDNPLRHIVVNTAASSFMP